MFLFFSLKKDQLSSLVWLCIWTLVSFHKMMPVEAPVYIHIYPVFELAYLCSHTSGQAKGKHRVGDCN